MVNLQCLGAKVDFVAALTLIIVALKYIFPNFGRKINPWCFICHFLAIIIGIGNNTY